MLPPSISPAIVAVLLEMGADPRCIDPVANLCNCELALMVYMHLWNEESQEKENIEHVMALMIKYGTPIDLKTIAKVKKEMQMPNVYHTPDIENSFSFNVEEQLKIIKQRLK